MSYYLDSQDYSFLHKVEWSARSDIVDILVWLRTLPMLDEKECAWKLHGVLYFSFYREEDAIAFKLKFG